MWSKMRICRFLVTCGTVLLLATPVLAGQNGSGDLDGDGNQKRSGKNNGAGPGAGDGDCTTALMYFDTYILLAGGGNGNAGEKGGHHGPGERQGDGGGVANDGNGPGAGTCINT